MLLVFDNYERLSHDSDVQNLLSAALEHLPAHLRVVILSTEASPASFARISSYRYMRTLVAGDLALTVELRAWTEMLNLVGSYGLTLKPPGALRKADSDVLFV